MEKKKKKPLIDGDVLIYRNFYSSSSKILFKCFKRSSNNFSLLTEEPRRILLSEY